MIYNLIYVIFKQHGMYDVFRLALKYYQCELCIRMTITFNMLYVIKMNISSNVIVIKVSTTKNQFEHFL